MSLNDELLAQLGESGLQQVAGLLGTDTATARSVVEAAAGAITGGLARNAETPDGAHALHGALDRHVDADPFTGDVATLSRDGECILGHVLGSQGTERAATGLARFAGVDRGTVAKLLPLIAPMIMSLLADRAARRGMDAGAVADDLDREQSAIRDGGLGDMLGELLGGIFGAESAPRGHRRRASSPDW
ncbi:DUF937 domain-containing protein [Nonomuraea longicatena]|uniref:DUF937 domain-containing protein n=1 Tax=Nonomuraea longicatena TaxID=83682 RepID=A0ABP3YZ83_9ACTN